jgi:hypothetical protein
MGLLKEGINEVIATTAFNAAPIGIHLREGSARMVLFTGTHTAQNIVRDGWVVANFVYDPVLYVKTAFGDLSRDAFVDELVNGKRMCRLAGAEAWSAFSAKVERVTGEAMNVSLVPEKENVEDVFVHPINRGFNSIIDATVHATRYAMNRDPELKNRIDYHAGIVRKCGGKKELAALGMLMGYIGERGD